MLDEAQELVNPRCASGLTQDARCRLAGPGCLATFRLEFQGGAKKQLDAG